MTNTIWSNPVSGNWVSASDWSDGVPTPSLDAIINAGGTYTVTINSADTAHSLILDAANATISESAGGSLTMAGGFTLDAGKVILNQANSFGAATKLAGGTLRLGNAAALGTSALKITGGALVATQNITLSNKLMGSGSFSLSATHGETVTFSGQTSFDATSGETVSFGKPGNDGVIVWSPLTMSVVNSSEGFSVDVVAGTLQDGNGRLGTILGATNSTTVAAGAQININGHSDAISTLNGDGIVTSLAVGGALTLEGSQFEGSIQGNIALTVAGNDVLQGVNTYNGGTTINSGGTLVFSSDGSITGNIVDNGNLEVQNTLSLGGISGTGSVNVTGGSLTLNGADTYTGGTTLANATLTVGNGNALGTGVLNFVGPCTLISTANETISNQLIVVNAGGPAVTFLAAHGTSLTFDSGSAFKLNIQPHLTFGSSTDDGTIIWDTGPTTAPITGIEIAGGTLRAGDNNFQSLIGRARSVTVDSGATVDVAGVTTVFTQIGGSGTIENTGAAATVTLSGGSFSGTIAGNITLDTGSGSLTLAGNAENWSTINLLARSHLILNGPSSADLVLSSSDNVVVLDDPGHFTGSIGALQSGDQIVFEGIGTGSTLSYSGDTSGGTLTVSNTSEGLSYSIALVGDYTQDEFTEKAGIEKVSVFFNSSAPSAPAHADTFDFSAAVAPHAAMDAGAAHSHGGHSASEVAFAHDVTEAMHAHGFAFDHFMHDLFAHHAMPEALG